MYSLGASSKLLHRVNRRSAIKNILIFLNSEIGSLHFMKTTTLRHWYCDISLHRPANPILWMELLDVKGQFLLELPCQGAKSLPIIALVLLKYFKPFVDFFFVLLFFFFCPTLKNINNLAIKCTATKYSTLICQILHNITTNITDQKRPLKYKKMLQ